MFTLRLSRFIASLFCFAITFPLYTKALETTTTDGSDTTATISITVENQEGTGAGEVPNFSEDDTLTVKADILPDFQQLIPDLNGTIPDLDGILPGLNDQIPDLNEAIAGIEIPIYILISYNSQFYVKNSQGQWEEWTPGDPLPISESRSLSGETEGVDIAKDLSVKGFSGKFEVYVGYGLPSGEIVYTLISAKFTVEPVIPTETSGSTSSSDESSANNSDESSSTDK